MYRGSRHTDPIRSHSESKDSYNCLDHVPTSSPHSKWSLDPISKDLWAGGSDNRQIIKEFKSHSARHQKEREMYQSVGLTIIKHPNPPTRAVSFTHPGLPMPIKIRHNAGQAFLS